MDNATIEFLLVFTASLLFLLIFLALYYLWNKTSEIEAITRKSVKTMTRLSGGTLLGLMGKEIWEALSSAKLPEDRREELENRYVYILQRHIERVLEQGMFDHRKGKNETPSSEAAIGGTKGEVQSWIPQKYVKTLYSIGQETALPSLDGEQTDLLMDKIQGTIGAMLSDIGMQNRQRVLFNRVRNNVNSKDDETDSDETD